MPVYKDKKNGTYYFRTYYKDADGNTRQTSRRGFKTKQEAREALRLFEPIREYELKKATAELAKKSVILFENMIDDFFFEESKRVKISTHDEYKYYFKNHITPFFKEKEITSITSKDIQAWQNNMLKKNLMNSTINKVYRVLRSYFDFLVTFEYININPCNKINTLREKEDVIKDVEDKYKVCDRDNFEKFINTFDEEELDKKCIFEVMYKVGTRKNETLGLQWKNIDFKNHTININKQVMYSSKGKILSTPKSKKSIRIINMCKSLEESLKKLWLIEKAKYGKIDDLFVFGGLSAIGATTIDRIREKKIKLAKIPHFTNHELRHSYGSNMLNDGFDIKYVSEQMGHESIAVTLSTYHHLISKTAEENKNKYYNFY